MKSVAFHNLGCKVNGYEMDYMLQALQEKGYTIVPFDGRADIYIINTCTVTNIADRKSRQMLHRAKRLNPESVVVAVGCYVQAGGEEALKDMSIDLAIGNNKKKDLIPILEEFLTNRENRKDKTLKGRTMTDIGKTDEYEAMELQRTAEHTRAFIKIQDGCNQFCSYCIIPYVRGRIRSRGQEEILHEVRRLSANGYREVVLTGIHLSSYGITGGNDFSTSKLSGLVLRLQQEEGIERIRLGSLEPRIITEEFVRTLSECGKLCPHFHLSLQSGCDRVLERMNRKYSTKEYYEKVCILRKYFDDPAITTDVIVGFPGETMEDFEETKGFLEKVGFYEMHIFKYSKRQGTPAAIMDGQIKEADKALRSNELLGLEKELSARYRQAHLHKQTEILFEEEKKINGRIYQVGHTKEYIRAAYETQENLSGQIVKGVLTKMLMSDILLFQPQIH
ncbi:tRNA (N(6)-L-threonylcarbamoyladenosine(37)-C(2))-methylthiotransferase MtaB [Parablautia intestinalis]|jgi:threonylcarbamoyladenosine tRNA methylthiotransferase MtaB|uniref:tRNA (N(6)-L-threonylcarbamoyladenosine(37)-C(2))- methylthiotransferase MtaB n=1 Tax=Parablautia intestinalis TaxID=2320100 RepID=UPI00259CBF26|nr:tRNA (N(6)-L-threonylcarbamoyladenosine(37)-C(2))-methylthiotransferase MtaB [Parablautia intestinalis]MCI8615269.1 tRNA (N(6)-L-threonylcarbamoyladenosine(37)-C(2))-methylthiotransferase MtaB [Lachnospiraceae bacterium]